MEKCWEVKETDYYLEREHWKLQRDWRDTLQWGEGKKILQTSSLAPGSWDKKAETGEPKGNLRDMEGPRKHWVSGPQVSEVSGHGVEICVVVS